MPVQSNLPHEAMENEINLFEVLNLFAKYKVFIIGITIAGTLATAVYNILQPNSYTGTATLIPVESGGPGGLSALLGSVGGDLGSLATSAGLGGKETADKFVTLLQTRTMHEKIIKDLVLAPVLLGTDEIERSAQGEWIYSMQDAVSAMRKRVEVKHDKKQGIVLVSFTTEDPLLSAKVANAYVTELDLYLKHNALSTSKKNRLFVEKQLEQAKREMAEHETALKNFQQKNQLVSLDAQAEASVQAYSDLKSKLIAGEIELTLLRKSSFEGDPRATLKEQEIAELRKQIKKIEQGGEQGPAISFAKAPDLGLNVARLKRELLVREKVFELLTQQYELARIQEAQEDISFQVLDPAIPPEKKSGPKRATNTLIALMVSAVLGVLMVLTYEFLLSYRDEKTASRQGLPAPDQSPLLIEK